MKNNNKLNKILFYLREYIYIINFLISIICLIFVGLHIVSFSKVLLNFNNNILYLIYRGIIFFCGLYSIFFLPFYPIFFLIKDFNYTLLERFSFTIFVNIAYYITVGYFSFLLGFDLTNVFFYFITIGGYSVCLSTTFIYLMIKGNLRESVRPIEGTNKMEFVNSFSIRQYLKEKVSLNIVLLIFFISLLCILNYVGNHTFCGTDPWLHIGIIKMITKMNYLPFTDYRGAMGLHILGALLSNFSGVDFIKIPSIFIFMSFPLSSLIVYLLFQKTFPNKNLAILGTFIAEFSSLGYGGIMQVFWPETIALIQCLVIFYLLYLRLNKFIEVDNFQLKTVLSNMGFSYIIIILLFLSAFLTHSLVTMVMIITFLWVYLIYFLKDYRRGIDFLLLCVFLGIFIVFYQLNIATGHFSKISRFFQLPLYYYFLIFLGLATGLIPIIWVLVKNIKLQDKRILKIDYNLLENYQNREAKIIIPSAIGILAFLTLIFIVGNLSLFNLDISTILIFIEMIIYTFFSIWGFVIFQKSTRGKVFFIWLIGFSFIMLFGLAYDFLISVNALWLRVLHMASPVLIIGFIFYIYKLIKIRSFKAKKFKLLLMIIIIFSLFSSLIGISQYYKDSTFDRREVAVSKWYGKYTTDKNVIIGRAGEGHLFGFYNYPYNNNNKTLNFRDTLIFERINESYAIPENHIRDSENILKELKSSSNSDVFILLTSRYLTTNGWKIYGNLNQEDRNEYYNLTYLNRVCSSKSITGNEEPLYWVI